MKKYEGILFDLDGTLLNTTEGVEYAVKCTIEELNYRTLTKEKLNEFVGPPMQDSFIREYGVSAEEAQLATNVFRRNYVDKSLFMAEPYPGLHKVLAALKGKGIKLGVATYKKESYALDILRHFGIADYCISMHGADNNNVLKKSDIVDLCIAEMNLTDRSKVVLIGDSEYDATGAEAAGVDFVGVTYGFGFKEKEKIGEYKAVGWVDSLEELLKFFE